MFIIYHSNGRASEHPFWHPFHGTEFLRTADRNAPPRTHTPPMHGCACQVSEYDHQSVRENEHGLGSESNFILKANG